MIAAKKGCLPAAEALLTAGASLAATSKVPSCSRHPKSIVINTDLLCDDERSRQYGETALHIAAQYKCQPEIAEFLVAKGIDETAVDEVWITLVSSCLVACGSSPRIILSPKLLLTLIASITHPLGTDEQDGAAAGGVG